MKRRLYFLLPDVGCARQILDELLLARVEERHIHMLAREDTPMEGLPTASLLQRSDFFHGIKTGLAVGGATGALVGFALLLWPLEGWAFGGGTVLILALAGAAIGAWASSMIGTSVPNSQLDQFAPAIEQGKVLLMVDVPVGAVQKISDMIHRRHPEASDHGIEPTIPAFP